MRSKSKWSPSGNSVGPYYILKFAALMDLIAWVVFVNAQRGLSVTIMIKHSAFNEILSTSRIGTIPDSAGFGFTKYPYFFSRGYRMSGRSIHT